MTKINNVINLLAKEELTSKEITERIGDETSVTVSVYLSNLLKDGTIEKTNDKKPFKYKKSLTPTEGLRFYNNFFKNNLDYLLKDSKINEYILNHEEFDKIEELVK